MNSKELIAPLFRRCFIESVHFVPTNCEVLTSVQSFKQPHSFGHNADLTFHFHRILREVDSEAVCILPEVGVSNPVSI